MIDKKDSPSDGIQSRIIRAIGAAANDTSRETTTRRLLLIEPGVYLPVVARNLPGSFAMILCRQSLLDASLLARVVPDYVVAPLFGRGFDILDILAKLVRCGYSGNLVVLSEPIPNWRIVVNELQAVSAQVRVSFAECDNDRIEWFRH